MGRKYVLQLLFCKKITISLITTAEAREKISTDWEYAEFKKLMYGWQNLEIIKFYLLELATDF